MVDTSCKNSNFMLYGESFRSFWKLEKMLGGLALEG